MAFAPASLILANNFLPLNEALCGMEVMSISKVFDKISDKVINSITKQYSQIFKGSISLFAVSLIGLSQLFPVILTHEHQARELQYKVEEKTNKKIDALECEKLKKYKSECNFAQYKKSTVESSVTLTFQIISYAFWFGVFGMAISTLGFVFSAFDEKPHNKSFKQDK